MTKDEFVELHGEDLWRLLVEPLQTYGKDYQRNNANVIVHWDFLMHLVRKMSDTAKGMRDIYDRGKD